MPQHEVALGDRDRRAGPLGGVGRFLKSERGGDQIARGVRPFAFLAAALVGIALFVGSRPFDSDGWWHLSDGELILDRGRLPARDPFSWTAAGKSWRLDTWLFDVMVAGLKRLSGRGVVVALTLSMFVALGFMCYLLARRSGARPWASVAAVIPAALFVTPNVAERAQMVSYLLFAVTIIVVRRALAGSNRALVGLALLFVLWVNVHLAFVAGVLLVGLVAGGVAVTTRQIARPAIVVAVALGAGLLNPYGVGAYTAALHVRAASWMINEWRHVNPFIPGDLALLALVVLAGWSMYRTGRWRQLDSLLPIVVFFALTVDAVRNGPFLLVLIVPELALAFSALAIPPLRARALAHGSALGVAIVVLSGLGSLPLRDVDDHVYAVRSVAAIPAGCRVLNEYRQGGYIIYRRWPTVRVSQDGRNDLYGAEELVAQQSVLAAKPGWRRWLTRHHVDCVLARPTRPIVSRLQAMGWSRAAEDPSGVLLLRP
jgi:hypothetical protein